MDSDELKEQWAIVDHERDARAKALLGAREALLGKAIMTSVPGPDSMDLLTLAQWIYNGEDPWRDMTNQPMTLRAVTDVELPEQPPDD